MSKKPNVLFAQIDYGTDVFRSVYIDILLIGFDGKFKKTATVNVFSDSWTNATYNDVMNNYERHLECLKKLLQLTEPNHYRTNGESAWVKKIAFAKNELGEQKFRSWATSVASKIRECAKNKIYEEIENKIFSDGNTN